MKLIYQLSSSKMNKSQVAYRLLNVLMNNDLSLITISSSRSIWRRLWFKSLKCGDFEIRLINFPDSNSVAYLLSIQWHRLSTRLLVCKNINLEELNKITSSVKNIEELEKQISEKIVFFIDPVDDDLELYGSDSTEMVIRKIVSLIETGQ